MAKMTLTVDTDTKEYSVTVDGEAVPNVSSVSAYQYGTPGDKYHEVAFEASAYETVGDVRKSTRLCASESAGAQQARDVEELGLPATFTKAQAGIVKAFNRRVGN